MSSEAMRLVRAAIYSGVTPNGCSTPCREGKPCPACTKQIDQIVGFMDAVGLIAVDRDALRDLLVRAANGGGDDAWIDAAITRLTAGPEPAA